ncbi:uncharacterized protein LOC114518269 [Dendronephthya gigantea]|uniref:uncharacterized protein LOC114518269 n=1 Tax=Dendronephthya gigantea TaxID=151771 RepID=UPI00106C58CE|nr:uncharacterized protein LOC114518269 [Dendronephthya gigantea]
MKSNAPSPRFLHEFDTVDTLAMRNIAEKRKLQRQIGELDKQLHSNLVRLDSEILSIRLENCEGPSQGKVKPVVGKDSVGNGKARTNNNTLDEARVSSQKTESNLVCLNDQHSTLPKIITSSYLKTKQEDYRGEDQLSGVELSNESYSLPLETISELEQKQMQAKKRILMSLQRPKLKLETTKKSRPPTPQATNQFLSPFTPLDRQRRASSTGLLSPLPDEYNTKDRLTRALSAPDVSESLSQHELGRLQNLHARRKQNQIQRGGENGSEMAGNNMKISFTAENDGPKSERKGRIRRLDPVKGTLDPRTKKRDFDDVIQRRLDLLQDNFPSKDDLEKIRYLRFNQDMDEEIDVDDLFAGLPQDKKG